MIVEVLIQERLKRGGEGISRITELAVIREMQGWATENRAFGRK